MMVFLLLFLVMLVAFAGVPLFVVWYAARDSKPKRVTRSANYSRSTGTSVDDSWHVPFVANTWFSSDDSGHHSSYDGGHGGGCDSGSDGGSCGSD